MSYVIIPNAATPSSTVSIVGGRLYRMNVPQAMKVSRVSGRISTAQSLALGGIGIYDVNSLGKLVSWDGIPFTLVGTFSAVLAKPFSLAAGEYLVFLSSTVNNVAFATPGSTDALFSDNFITGVPGFPVGQILTGGICPGNLIVAQNTQLNFPTLIFRE